MLPSYSQIEIASEKSQHTFQKNTSSGYIFTINIVAGVHTYIYASLTHNKHDGKLNVTQHAIYYSINIMTIAKLTIKLKSILTSQWHNQHYNRKYINTQHTIKLNLAHY